MAVARRGLGGGGREMFTCSETRPSFTFYRSAQDDNESTVKAPVRAACPMDEQVPS